MLYMLDTNILSDLVRNRFGKAFQRIKSAGEDNVCTSIIVAAEMRYGITKKGVARLTQTVEELLREITILPFEAPADEHYGNIKAELMSAGNRIGEHDFLIAAHARSEGATLVTNNAGEFVRVRGLAVENWLE